jgi:hypothetical protein
LSFIVNKCLHEHRVCRLNAFHGTVQPKAWLYA